MIVRGKGTTVNVAKLPRNVRPGKSCLEVETNEEVSAKLLVVSYRTDTRIVSDMQYTGPARLAYIGMIHKSVKTYF